MFRETGWTAVLRLQHMLHPPTCTVISVQDRLLLQANLGKKQLLSKQSPNDASRGLVLNGISAMVGMMLVQEVTAHWWFGLAANLPQHILKCLRRQTIAGNLLDTAGPRLYHHSRGRHEQRLCNTTTTNLHQLTTVMVLKFQKCGQVVAAMVKQEILLLQTMITNAMLTLGIRVAMTLRTANTITPAAAAIPFAKTRH